ncbi:glycosyltransferase family 2 protein [Marinobacter halodurans]|uniref:Glycosyltransferase family 2 protein n=1 Tax=Marinobacter halodurans TaxID=2528979 RepID=A0ABY1ZLK0_9GAMM|nr:glycosyltransferase family 2 protein [Marinobacter halodurans]TBW56715.1 glycosyltransferase family 2 protein [Marinobacter halodurans]
MKLSIIIPAKNEANSLKSLIPELKLLSVASEIIVVNDGSSDNTSEICKEHNVKEVLHPYSKGNGAAVKSGAREATGDVLIFMDGDGQHRPEDIHKLVEGIRSGYDMVIGSRNAEGQANIGRGFANGLYNRLASYVTGHEVKDLTSGFRAVNALKFREFLYLLPNGFSYPTTSTLAFFRAGYSVSYVGIDVKKRIGKSHLKPVKDGVRFLLIIFKIGTLYSPLKLFVPVSLSVFLLGVAYYCFTYITQGRFTNMSALMFTTSLVVFMVGLVSEQITALMYKNDNS